MALADKVATPPKPKTGFECSVGKLLRTLPDDETGALQAMLDDPNWQHRALYRTIIAEGYEVGEQTIGHHRRRDCRCYR